MILYPIFRIIFNIFGDNPNVCLISYWRFNNRGIFVHCYDKMAKRIFLLRPMSHQLNCFIAFVHFMDFAVRLSTHFMSLRDILLFKLFN